MKLVVVGCGIGGSMVARLARERGHEVTVVSDGWPPHSLAATVVLRHAYQAGKPEQESALKYALGLYEDWGVELRRGGEVGSYRRPEAAPHADADWVLMDPESVLVQPDIKGRVLTCTSRTAWLGAEDEDAIKGDAVVVATGADASFLPEDSSITWGLTWTHVGSALSEPDKTRVFQYAPYRTLIAGVTGVRARVGSSSAKTKEKAVEQGRAMLKQAWELGWLTTATGWTRVLGARLKTDRLHWKREDGAWQVGGFHRTGYALAPGAARDLLDEIEKAG